METKPVKPNSLTELGYKITAMHGKDSKGNDITAKVVGEAPVFYIKRTKRGRLMAVKEKESHVESTIDGLYNFQEKDGDLVGERAVIKKVTQAA